ncbi:MAG: hypothetical protein KDB01_20650 [Planctomycetaceae bacterium]|nr:hypothetical protein [Planctomycetaceae bacterium]
MKKMSLTAALFSLIAAGVISSSANACDRVIYSGSRVVYSAPVVHSAPAVPSGTVIHSTPVVYSSITAPAPAIQSRTETFRVTQVTQKVVAPVVVEKKEVVQVVEKLPEIIQGSTLRARVRLAGYEAGEVTISSGSGLEMQCEVIEWTPSLITFRMPNVEIVSDAEISIRITAADRTSVKTVKAMLVTGADITIEPPVTTLAQN